MQNKLTILLLEDDSEDVEIIRYVLKDNLPDMQYHVASSKTEYLSALAGIQPDCILADNSVTGMNAATALIAARAQFPDIPFIMVTGAVPESYAIDMIKSGADDYILKDRLQRLPAAIEAAVNKFRAAAESKKNLERLQENEEKYRTLIERVSDGFIAIDKEWCLVYANKKAEQILGRPAGSLMGKNIWEEFPDAVGEPFYRAYHTAMDTQENAYVKAYSAAVDRWIVSYIYPSPTGLSVYFGDITKQKKAEERIRHSEEKYRELVERITDAFIALDKDFCYTYLNRRAGELVHRDPGELIGKNVWDVFPDAVGSETYNSFLRAMNEQVYVCSTDYYAPLDLWQENHIYPSPEGLSVFIRDITNTKRDERQREFDRHNLSALINNTKDMMWSTDNELRLVTFNDAFNDVVIGLSGKPLKAGDSAIAEQFAPELIAFYRAHYQRALEGESFTVVDYFAPPVDLWSEISFYPIRKDGIVTGIACFARDVTEAKRSEQTMRKMEKEIVHQQIQEQKKIARAIIHAQEQERNRIGQELHDNVNQILAATKIFLTSTAKTDAARDAIKYPIQLIDNSIEEIRSLSSKQVTPLKNIPLKEMIGELVDKMQANGNVNAVLEYDDQHDRMDDDLKLNIYRIIQEQVNNIVKYAGAGNVLVSIHIRGDGTHVVISDDGKGFDTAKKRKGIGISNMINRVEAFNGAIEIDSSPGKGCRVTVFLPGTGYVKVMRNSRSA